VLGLRSVHIAAATATLLVGCTPRTTAEPWNGSSGHVASQPDAATTPQPSGGNSATADSGMDATLYDMDAAAADTTIPAEVRAIFERSCSGAYCHVGAASPALGLDLSAAAAFESLVGVAAQQAPSMKRVAPGDAGASFLICRIAPQPAAATAPPTPVVGEALPVDHRLT
jgi:hypothetical protein